MIRYLVYRLVWLCGKVSIFYNLKFRNDLDWDQVSIQLKYLSTSKPSLCWYFLPSLWARNRVGIGLWYRPARLHRLAQLVPWNRFLGSLKVKKFGLWSVKHKLDQHPVIHTYQWVRWTRDRHGTRAWISPTLASFTGLYQPHPAYSSTPSTTGLFQTWLPPPSPPQHLLLLPSCSYLVGGLRGYSAHYCRHHHRLYLPCCSHHVHIW